MGDSVGTFVESASKALFYAGVLTAVGACAARWRLAPALQPPGASHLTSHLHLRFAAVGAAAGAVAVGASALRVWAHTAVAFGVTGAFAWDSLRVIAVESRWGSGWRIQMISAALVCASFRWAGRRPSAGWVAAACATAAACCTVPLLGHAAGDAGRSAIHVAHVLGGGIWLGGLATIVFATRVTHASTDASRAALLHELAAVALPGAALIAVSGTWASWLYVGSLANLVNSIYGRVLIAKLLLIGAVLVCGFVNWQRYRLVPRSILQARDPDRAQLPDAGVVLLELVFAALVVVATSFLTELEHPTS